MVTETAFLARTFSFELSGIGYRLSVIGYRLSAIGYRLSAIGYRLSGGLLIMIRSLASPKEFA
jgi:hypothetical protein